MAKANRAGRHLSARIGGIDPKFEGKVVLLDAGHGGVIDGVYQTSGKRSYFKNGILLGDEYSTEQKEEMSDEKYYEGEGNRKIRQELNVLLHRAGIPYRNVNQGNDDMSLQKRCDIVNDYCVAFGTENVLLISIHSDAFSDPDAHGWSAYTSPGNTASDPVATVMYGIAEEVWPWEKFRKGLRDGDPDKEAKFKILVGTKPRAVLVENFFFTNYDDYTNHLKTNWEIQKIAKMLFNTIEATL